MNREEHEVERKRAERGNVALGGCAVLLALFFILIAAMATYKFLELLDAARQYLLTH